MSTKNRTETGGGASGQQNKAEIGKEKCGNSGRIYPDTRDEEPGQLRDPEAALDYYEDPYNLGKLQGEYTTEDYYALPDDVRAELIDGRLYDMAAPRSAHGIIGYRISRTFDSYIEKKRGKCLATDAAMNVQLDCTKPTVVQPDVFILCDTEKLGKNKILGAPDLVVEILSPSTELKDKKVKLKKYRESGVREYWIVDPDEREVLVYCFSDTRFDMLPARYTFQDKVPVGIFGGECEVDFGEISRYLARYQLD